MKKIEYMDPLLPQALKILVKENDGNVSITRLQRKFAIGYPRAARIVDQMEEMEVISNENPKKVIISIEDIEEALEDETVFKKYSPAQAVSKAMSYYSQKQEKKTEDDISKLNLEKIKLFSFEGIELETMKKNEICEKLKEAVASKNVAIGIDYSGLKKFLLKKEYKVHSLRMPFDSEISSEKYKIVKNSSIFMLEIHMGTDFSKVIEVCNDLDSTFGSGAITMKVIEDAIEPNITVLY